MEKRVGSHKFLVVSAGECAREYTHTRIARGEMLIIFMAMGGGKRLPHSAHPYFAISVFAK